MNYLWGGMIIIGILYAACTGNLPNVTQAALDSSKEAVALCVTMTGIMALWSGLMNIAEHAGIIVRVTKLLKPALLFLFPKIPQGHPANKYIAENCIANIFGLGWAATPAGLKAMKSLKELEEHKTQKGQKVRQTGTDALSERKKEGIASDEMCTFLILNISSLQLIPVNMIAYRSQYGSASPAEIIGPAIIATICSTLAAVVYCKMRAAMTDPKL